MILWLAYGQLIKAVPEGLPFSGDGIDLDPVQQLPQERPFLLHRAMSKQLPEEPQPLAELFDGATWVHARRRSCS